jgi:hypothetical protein
MFGMYRLKGADYTILSQIQTATSPDSYRDLGSQKGQSILVDLFFALHFESIILGKP